MYRLNKGLYRIKKAPRDWYYTLSKYIVDNAFREGIIGRTLFTINNDEDMLWVQLYVDDIIFGSPNQRLSEKFGEIMKKKYEMSMIGLMSYFFGLQVKQLDKGIFINKAKYTRDMLTTFGV